MPVDFRVEPHDRYAKWINVNGPLRFAVDNDDVDTSAVELLLPILVDILNKNLDYLSVPVYRCVNEECEEYWRAKPIYDDGRTVDAVCGVCRGDIEIGTLSEA